MRFELEIEGRRFSIERRTDKGQYRYLIDGEALSVSLQAIGPETYSLLLDDQVIDLQVLDTAEGIRLHCQGRSYRAREIKGRAGGVPLAMEGEEEAAEVRAPMPGKIVKVLVGEGDPVEKGQPLLVMEAMKMQNELRAPRRGKVVSIAVREGQAVPVSAFLLRIE